MKHKIAIMGYGSMGREIERLASNDLFEITDIFDIDRAVDKTKKYDFNIAIDFTQPDTAMNNIDLFASMGKSIVLGTTGWYDKIDEVKSIVEKSGIGFLWASNFSIGMQMFMRITQFAAKLANKIDDYDLMLHELHHKRKKDSPSGTAHSLEQLILNEVERKNEVSNDAQYEAISKETLHSSSTRGGEIPGTHTLYIDSLADTIELTHRARNRSGFAMGSLKAAEWLDGKKGFYSIDDMLKDIWE